mgnify:CR=1 FL=1
MLILISFMVEHFGIVLENFRDNSDIELSQEGISQAEKLAENFPVTHIDRVYSSNLKRAYITGEIIAKNLMCQSSKINAFVRFLSALGKV